MGDFSGPNKLSDNCGKMTHMGMTDRGFTVLYFHTSNKISICMTKIQLCLGLSDITLWQSGAWRRDKACSTHWTGGWVGSTADLVVKGKIWTVTNWIMAVKTNLHSYATLKLNRTTACSSSGLNVCRLTWTWSSSIRTLTTEALLVFATTRNLHHSGHLLYKQCIPTVEYHTAEVPSEQCSSFYTHSQNCKMWLFASPCLPLYLSTCNNSAPIGRIFMKFDIWEFFVSLLRKFKWH